MYYTIVCAREHGGEEVELISNGNKYEVAFCHESGAETTRKAFSTMHEALKTYQKFIEAFATGCYSYEDRKSWLK